MSLFDRRRKRLVFQSYKSDDYLNLFDPHALIGNEVEDFGIVDEYWILEKNFSSFLDFEERFLQIIFTNHFAFRFIRINK